MAIQRRESNIGDIRQSMLTEAQFQLLNGTGWVLMDGRDITGSGLAAVTGVNTLADARGLVLRGKNNGRADGNQDPSGERAVGSFQAHATARNGLGISDPGHDHALGVGSFDSTGGVANSRLPDFLGGFSGVVRRATGSGTGISLGAGDAETRMSNIAVNTFIKIN